MAAKVIKILILITGLVWTSWSQGEANCATLIQQGLYDTYSQSTFSSDYSQMVADFCGSYSQYLNNQRSSSSASDQTDADSSIHGSSNGVGGSVGFFGFGASGSYTNSNLKGQSTFAANAEAESLSTDQVQAIAGFLCNGANNTQATSGALQELSSVIDPNVLAAYNDCLTQSEAGLQVSTTIQEDQGQVTITLDYQPPMGAPDQVLIENITITPSNSWNCSGPLWNLIQDASSNTGLSNDALGMTCVRTISPTNFSYLGQSLYAMPSTITIFTSAGTVLRSFAPIYASPPIDVITSLEQEIANLKSNTLKFNTGTIQRYFTDTGYSLNTGSGKQQDCTVLQFSQNYTQTPTVTASFYYLNTPALNAMALVTEVQPTNFTLCVFVWSPLNGYGVSWVALGV